MKKYIIGLAGFALIALLFLNFYSPRLADASVAQGGEYSSTETAPGLITSTIISPFYGTLGSVIVTGANTGTWTLYDASTSNASLRTPVNGSTATSSLRQIASFPASIAAGTYTFDAKYYNGLVLEGIGSIATSTITFRY